MLRAYMDIADMRDLYDFAGRMDAFAMLIFMTQRGRVEVQGEQQGASVIWHTERATYYGRSALSLGHAFSDCARVALLPPEHLPAAGLPGVVEYPARKGA